MMTFDILRQGFFFYPAIIKVDLMQFHYQVIVWNLSQTTNFRLVQTERVCRRQLRLDENGKKFSKRVKTLWEKEKLLSTSNFSFSHSVFKRLVLQIGKNQGSCGKGLNFFLHVFYEIEIT